MVPESRASRRPRRSRRGPPRASVPADSSQRRCRHVQPLRKSGERAKWVPCDTEAEQPRAGTPRKHRRVAPLPRREHHPRRHALCGRQPTRHPNASVIVCILRAPTPPTATPEPIEDMPSPGAGVQVSGGGGGLKAGPVVGIALVSGVAAVATAGMATFGYRWWATAWGSGGGSGSSERGGGSGGGDGGGGAKAVGVSAGAPVETPGVRTTGVPPAHKPAAAVPLGGAVAGPSSAPPLPAGLMYSWATVTRSGSAAPLEGS